LDKPTYQYCNEDIHQDVYAYEYGPAHAYVDADTDYLLHMQWVHVVGRRRDGDPGVPDLTSPRPLPNSDERNPGETQIAIVRIMKQETRTAAGMGLLIFYFLAL
jgi:hypothetical protein